MKMRVTTHIEECKIRKADSDWVGRVAYEFQEAFATIRNHDVSPTQDCPVYVDGYLTLRDPAVQFSSVPIGINVGRFASTMQQPIKATIHYRAFDLKDRSQSEIRAIVTNDFNRVVAVIKEET